MREGVPQRGLLSLTLLLVFINDIMKNMQHKIHAAKYVDNLVLWCPLVLRKRTDNSHLQYEAGLKCS